MRCLRTIGRFPRIRGGFTSKRHSERTAQERRFSRFSTRLFVGVSGYLPRHMTKRTVANAMAGRKKLAGRRKGKEKREKGENRQGDRKTRRKKQAGGKDTRKKENPKGA